MYRSMYTCHKSTANWMRKPAILKTTKARDELASPFPAGPVVERWPLVELWLNGIDKTVFEGYQMVFALA